MQIAVICCGNRDGWRVCSVCTTLGNPALLLHAVVAWGETGKQSLARSATSCSVCRYCAEVPYGSGIWEQAWRLSGRLEKQPSNSRSSSQTSGGLRG